MAISDPNYSEQERKRRIRRSAFLLTALALAFYVGFILIGVRSALG